MAFASPVQPISNAAVSRRVVLILFTALLIAAAAVLGFNAGMHHRSDGHTLAGRAYVGDQQAGVRVGSWTYNIPTSTGALEWFDANGEHEGSTAPCLRAPGTYTWVRFGYTVVQGPTGTSWRQVSWVRCMARP